MDTLIKGIKYLYLPLLMIGVAACLDKPDTKVSPDRYYTTYMLVYDEETNQTLARAIFSADTRDGWRQELSGSAKVEYEGAELEFNEADDEYVLLFNDLLTFGEFKYTDQVGNTYMNPSEIKVIGYPSGLDSLDSSKDLELRWVGDALKEGEFVTLTFEEESTGVVGVYQQSRVGANSMTIPSSELVKFRIGSIGIRLTWEKILETNEDPGVGGEVHSAAILMAKPVVIYQNDAN